MSVLCLILSVSVCLSLSLCQSLERWYSGARPPPPPPLLARHLALCCQCYVWFSQSLSVSSTSHWKISILVPPPPPPFTHLASYCQCYVWFCLFLSLSLSLCQSLKRWYSGAPPPPPPPPPCQTPGIMLSMLRLVLSLSLPLSLFASHCIVGTPVAPMPVTWHYWYCQCYAWFCLSVCLTVCLSPSLSLLATGTLVLWCPSPLARHLALYCQCYVWFSQSLSLLPVTGKFVFWWPPCHTPGIILSVLRLVLFVSVSLCLSLERWYSCASPPSSLPDTWHFCCQCYVWFSLSLSLFASHCIVGTPVAPMPVTWHYVVSDTSDSLCLCLSLSASHCKVSILVATPQYTWHCIVSATSDSLCLCLCVCVSLSLSVCLSVCQSLESWFS